MLRISASRIVNSSRQSLRSSLRLSDPSRSERSYVSISQFHATSPFMGRREEHRSSLPNGALPMVSLNQCQPLTLPYSLRHLSTSSTPAGSDEPSMREKMAARKESAKKGAHSLREMMKKYGPLFLYTYAGVYFATLGSLFAGIESGALDPAYVLSWVSDEGDNKSTVQIVVEFLEHYSWTSPFAPMVESNPAMANLGVAWIGVKFTEPIRFGTTVAIVPRLSRYLGLRTAEQTELNDEEKK